jgi:precorrin-6Y C5,15-methyltransferase (decarboxylating)
MPRCWACGTAPEALADLPQPDAVFLGGGVSDGAIWDSAWSALKPGGRLIANAVTLAGEAVLVARHATLGGELARMSVAHAQDHRFWRQAMPVTQLALIKPR